METPSSIIPFVVDIHSLLDPQAHQCLRKINFMSYEVAAQGKNYGELDRLHLLNDYFFNTQGFQISEEENHRLWSVHHVIDERRGAPLPVALIYLHLAAYIDLPFYLIQLQGFRIIKWVLGKHSKYINLASRGALLDEKQILDILNESTREKTGPFYTQLEIIPTKVLLMYYVQSLIELFKAEGQEAGYKTMLDVVLKISPSNLNFLGQRALLLKKMRLYREAMVDFKKYFSFVGLENAPQDIKMSFYELKSIELRSVSNWSPSPSG